MNMNSPCHAIAPHLKRVVDAQAGAIRLIKVEVDERLDPILATEAAAAALECAFSRLGLHKVTVHAFASNAPSLRVIAKLGFSKVGVKRRDVSKGGVWHDQVAYELLRDDRNA